MRNFCVYGEPCGKGRHIVTRTGHAFTPKKTVYYENNVKQSYISKYENEMPYEKGVELEVELFIYYSIPSSASKKKRQAMISGEIRPTKKPDIDNCIKAVFDSLNGIMFHDDSQIVKASAIKYYGIQPRVEVTVKERGE